jgi:hypothetical protein
MILPYLQNAGGAAKKYVVSFRGLNYGEDWQDGELETCTNLSAEKYPCISQRAARVKEADYISPTTLHAKEGLLVIDGTRVLYDGENVGTVTEGRKQTATIGNYIVIFPDKKYYNVAAGTFGNMEAAYTAAGLVFTASTITTTGEDFPFKEGDAVTITGCSIAENNKTPIVRGVNGKTLTFYDNTFTEGTESGSVTIKRSVPDLDFICESNYRLWGTHGNTIYSSKYSDPMNFSVFDGLSSDSYYIDVGSDGAFTGCIPYSSHICFFKENTLHKLYGSKPSNFQIVTSNVYGVQAGCERSMCIVNEQLLYKGVDGVYSYSGGVPELISGKLGTVRFSEAAAACDGTRYYISMKRGTEWSLFVYDVLKNIWLREDDTHAVDMAFYNGYLYYLDAAGKLYKIDREADRDGIEWSAAFCPFHETINERKGYSKFHLRVELEAGAWLSADIRTDQDTQWREVYTTHNQRAKTMSIPIVPTRCDSVRIRLRGKGECMVKTFIREFTTGSDV